MKTTRIANGIRVKCNCTFDGQEGCGKYHVVKGIRGNNLGWEDASGWTGSYDAAHGFFKSTQSPTTCPDCKKEAEKRQSDEVKKC
jgi:hypothetical protein